MAGRAEDSDLITGRGRFVEDLADAGTLRAGFVRSPVPHGRIRDVDLSDVSSHGAQWVFLGSDLGLEPQPGKLRESLPGHIEYRRPILADEVVRFAGEAVALVVADTEQAALDTIERVWVELDELPAVLSVEEALDDTVVLHPTVGTNRAVTARFETDEPPRWDSGHQIEMVIDSPRVAPAPMEPLSILVRPDGSHYDIACGTQTPHRLKTAVAAGLGVAEEHMRVAIPEVGGAFGQKGAVYVEYLAIARAAQLLQRPILWAQRRRDNLGSATHGRGARHRIRLGGTSDGTLTQAEVEIVSDLGAYPQMGGVVPLTSAAMAPGPYHFDRFSVEAVGVLTNRTPTGPYRGAGRPEATFALERAIDAFARHLGVEPHDVRRRSLLPPHADGASSATGVRYDSGDYRAPLDIAVAAVDPAGIREERARRLATGERVSIGSAVSCFVERAGGPVDFGEHAVVSLQSDGTLDVKIGTAPTGQGHRTVFSNIVAEAFGVPGRSITWTAGDTAGTEAGGGTYGSRSGQLGGTAITLATQDLATRCRTLAADILEAAGADVVLENGTLSVVGVPGSEIGLEHLAEIATERGVSLSASSHFVAPSQTFPYGSHGVVVEVDVDTGDVTVKRVVAVDDCGRVLDPMIVAGQVHGSLAQGYGQAMREVVVTSETGDLLSSTFMDYLIPTASDVPAWELHHTYTPSPSNPLGVKGIGESGTIGLPPAIVNAALDALTPFGVQDLDMPLTPSRVWTALSTATVP